MATVISPGTLTKWTDRLVTLAITITIGILLAYIAMRIGNLLLTFTANPDSTLHEVAYIIVLIKAYRLLLYYLEHHHVSIKYIIEISIIAPAIEIIFAFDQQSTIQNIIYGFFSLANLIAYLVFFQKICTADRQEDDPTTSSQPSSL